VIAATAVDQPPVALVEMKEPIELRHRWLLAVAAVGGELAAAQEIDRHGPQPPRLVRPLITLAVSLHSRAAIRGDRRRRTGRQMPVQAGARDPRLRDDLRDRVALVA
jgi:hypothetical protein